MNMTEYQSAMENNEKDPSSLVSVVSQAVILLVLLVVSIVSNLLVFVVFYQRPALRSLSNRFVLSLVSSNLLTAIFLMPVSLVSLLMQQWVFTIWCCKASKVVAALLTIACTLSLVLIAIDRYLAIMSPLHYNMIITRTRCSAMIASVWTLAAILAMLPIMGLTENVEDVYKTSRPDVELLVPCSVTSLEAQTLCVAGRGTNGSATEMSLLVTQFRLCGTVTSTVVSLVRQKHRPWFALLLGMVGFGLPLFLIGWIYTCMYRAAHRTSARARKHSVITFNSCDLPSLDSSVTSRSRTPGLVSQIVAATSPINSTPSAVYHDHHTLQQIRKRLYRRRSSNTSLSFILFREEGKAATTSIMVVGSLLCCCLPYFASALWEAFAPFRHGCHDIPFSAILTSPTFQAFSQLLLFAGCAINPFIYVYRNNIARKDAIRLLGCQFNPKQQVGHNNAFYKQDMRKRGAMTVRTPSVEENDSETPPPSIVVRLDHNNYNNNNNNEDDDADTASLASCNGTVLMVSNGLSEPSLVRKLSQRVCKSVSLAEDVLIKGRRHSMRRQHHHHHDQHSTSDDDQVKMVDYCADDYEMTDCDDAESTRRRSANDESNEDRSTGPRALAKKRLSLKRLTRSLSKGMNSHNSNNNRHYNSDSQNANNSMTNNNNNGPDSNENDDSATDTVLMIRSPETEVTPFTLRVSDVSSVANNPNKKPRISKDDFLLMPEPSGGASDKGRKSEPDLSSAAAALCFHSNNQRSAVSANNVCGYGLSPQDVPQETSLRSTSSNPFLPVTSEQTFRASPTLFLVTNPFAEVTTQLAGVHVNTPTAFSASNSPSTRRQSDLIDTHPSSSLASSTSSLSSKMQTNSTAKSKPIFPSPDITIDVTDTSGNTVGWPTSFI